MAYSTATSILIILPGLPQTATSSGYTSTVAIVEDHIDRADNIINGKLASRYDVSQFTVSVPPQLRTISEDISSYYTYRSIFTNDNQNFNEWTDKFKDAMDLLEQIRKGEMDLVDDSGALVEIRTTGSQLCQSSTEDYSPTFGEDRVLDWEVDEDKLDSLADDRG